MANRIKPLRRTGSTGVPNVASMQDGEIAVNAFEKKIFMKVGDNLTEIANASIGVPAGGTTGQVLTKISDVSGDVGWGAAGGGSAGVPTVVNVNTSVTLSSTHVNTMCEKTNTGTTTLTMPATLGSVGDAILFVNNSTGTLNINRASGVTIMTYGSNANVSIPANRAALLVRTSTASKWVRA